MSATLRLNVKVQVSLECDQCGAVAEPFDRYEWIDENTYDKRWGLDILEDWQGACW